MVEFSHQEGLTPLARLALAEIHHRDEGAADLVLRPAQRRGADEEVLGTRRQRRDRLQPLDGVPGHGEIEEVLRSGQAGGMHEGQRDQLGQLAADPFAGVESVCSRIRMRDRARSVADQHGLVRRGDDRPGRPLRLFLALGEDAVGHVGEGERGPPHETQLKCARGQLDDARGALCADPDLDIPAYVLSGAHGLGQDFDGIGVEDLGQAHSGPGPALHREPVEGAVRIEQPTVPADHRDPGFHAVDEALEGLGIAADAQHLLPVSGADHECVDLALADGAQRFFRLQKPAARPATPRSARPPCGGVARSGPRAG